MKTMTCKQLGGAFDLKFKAETFDEISELSKQHGMEMFNNGDDAHIKAMQEMQELMKDPNAMQDWMDSKRNEFDALSLN